VPPRSLTADITARLRSADGRFAFSAMRVALEGRGVSFIDNDKERGITAPR
jgi:hypothetical protein